MPRHEQVPKPVQSIWAQSALTASGWADGVTVTIGPNGRILDVQTDTQVPGSTNETGRAPVSRVGILLPAPTNVHSHAFQRALAGLTEHRGTGSDGDSFWTWRTLMYRFLDQLEADDIEAISAFVYMQMLQVGWAAVGEFHYLHHQRDGAAYDDPAELSHRVMAAAQHSGIGLCLLPVLYQQGGCDARPLGAAQRRFGNNFDDFIKLHTSAGNAMRQLDADCTLGVAPHSLRAVPASSLRALAEWLPHAPVHIHIAEQTAEVDEVLHHTGSRPVRWLLDECGVDSRWCLVHATHMHAAETRDLAASGAVVGLCPITEANLGDGIFDGKRYVGNGGRFAIGSDSNVRISLVEELRLLEYSQRLKQRSRAVLATNSASTGRFIYESVARGGAQATQRDAGEIAPGRFADLLALNAQSSELHARHGDALLDSLIFTAADDLVTDVWSGGRHLVRHGQHIHHDAITDRYRATMDKLRAAL